MCNYNLFISPSLYLSALLEKYHDIEHHPLVEKASTYKTFVDYVHKKAKHLGHYEFENSRNVKFEVKKGNYFTQEALSYLNQEFKFAFKDEILKPEADVADLSSLRGIASSVLNFKRNLSGKDLLAMCDLDDDNEFNDAVDMDQTFMVPNNSSKEDFRSDNLKRSTNYQEEPAKRSNLLSNQNPQNSSSGLPIALPSPVHKPATINTSYQISSIYNDLNRLKKTFGVYKLFKGIEPEVWIERVDIFLNLNYSSNKKEIVKFFYIFLSNDYHKWFFDLNSDCSFDDMKTGFLDQSYDIVKSYHKMMYAGQTEFLNLIKSNFDVSDADIAKNKFKVYFENKFKIFGKTCPNRSIKEIILDSIMLIEDESAKLKYYGLRNLEIDDFITSIKYNK